MKKVLTLLAMASMFAFASCGPDNPDTPEKPDPDPVIPTLTLSAANIDVSGIDGDYMAVVDNAAKTIKISLEYADKENAKALTVSFLNIPEGFTTEYQKTFNYSNGATQTVTFKYEEKTAAEYVISVTIGAADPKFLTLTVAGQNAMGGEVQLSGAAALSALAVEFTVDPAETVVSVNGNAIESGAALDFSDKLNGVTFTLTCGEAVKTHQVVVKTSGIRKAERVWGHYVQPKNVEDSWYATATRGIEGWWQRTIAMDDQYVYIAQHGKDAVGPYVLSMTDGELVKTLSGTGIEGGTHIASAVRTIPDGSGYRVLQCNLAIGGTLKVYTWDSLDANPKVVLSYENTDGLRLGDKIGIIGTWEDGIISFLSGNGADSHKLYRFAVKSGVINATPTVVEVDGFGKASYGQEYKYSDTEYVVSCAGERPILFNVSGNTYTRALTFDSSIFGATDEGINFFEFNDQKYMAFAHLEDGMTDCSLRIIPLVGDSLSAALSALSATAAAGENLGVFRYGLSDPQECPIAGFKSGNSLCDCIVREIGGETYIAALSEGAGVSLFKLEE
jgi:hypothetical protein